MEDNTTTNPAPPVVEAPPNTSHDEPGHVDAPTEPTALSRAEYNVLSLYMKCESEGSYRTFPVMATSLGLSRAEFDKLLSSLRKREWVEGSRKVTVTELGKKSWLSVAEYLKAKQEQVTPASKTADTTPATVPQPSRPVESYNRAPETVQGKAASISDILAARLHVSAKDVFNVIKNNVINVGNGKPASDAEVMQVMSVMQKYELDPFMKQVHAFRHRGKLQIAVGTDGWTATANRNPAFGGVEYEFPDEMVEKEGKMCWPWVKATCHMKGRVPTVRYAFLEEWFVPTKPTDTSPSNWSMYPTHRLQGKAYTLSIKEAMGISLYDMDDVEQFHNIEALNVTPKVDTGSVLDRLDGLAAPAQLAENLDEDYEVVDYEAPTEEK